MNNSNSTKSIIEKYREKQSDYRDRVLNEPSGVGPYRYSKEKHGNMLVNGEVTGSNFISKAAYNYAKQKVLDKEVNKYLTIDEYRLFNNMLSSMPMCFNLFADLRQMLTNDTNEVTRIVKELFTEIVWIDKVCFIDIEFIPLPIEKFINDKSAFDAIIIAQDKQGLKGVISIETKYTDILGENTSPESENKKKLATQLFSKNLVEELKENGYKQIHRNLLLTLSFAKENNYKYFHNIIISPNEDKLSINQVEELKSEMKKYKDSICKISLEEFVKRGINCNNVSYSGLMKYFKSRYIID